MSLGFGLFYRVVYEGLGLLRPGVMKCRALPGYWHSLLRDDVPIPLVLARALHRVPANAADSLYCMHLAQNAVDGAITGFTSEPAFFEVRDFKSTFRYRITKS
jgi:hypothetical protein